jgi:hypothetical protein
MDQLVTQARVCSHAARERNMCTLETFATQHNYKAGRRPVPFGGLKVGAGAAAPANARASQSGASERSGVCGMLARAVECAHVQAHVGAERMGERVRYTSKPLLSHMLMHKTTRPLREMPSHS